MKNKKVLLYPGAFNPPHIGHIAILKLALSDFMFDEVWIIPSGNRRDKKIEISFDDRRNLNRLFVDYLNENCLNKFILRTDELDSVERKETTEILDIIKSEPDMEFTQLIGLDGYLSLKDTVEKKYFIQEDFIIINRMGYSVPMGFSFPKNHIFVENNSIEEVSSTKIRDMIKNHDINYKKFLIKDISEYIEKHKLYK